MTWGHNIRGGNNYLSWVEKRSEIDCFLKEMKSLLSGDNGVRNLQIPLKNNLDEDKNYQFRVEHNLKSGHICKELLKLDITNYSYTDYDDNPKFKNEKVWIFGQMFSTKEVYIKLKIRGKVVCLSFHEKGYDLKYPFLNGGCE